MKKRYCYLTPEFPEEAYAAILFLDIEGNKGIFPLAPLFKTPDEVSEYVEHLLKDSKKSIIQLQEYCILLPLKLEKLYQLKREYWNNPTQHYDTFDRMRLFLQVPERAEFLKLLVVPELYEQKTKKWHLKTSIPFSNDDLIEKFMYTSDERVDERAKYAGIYKFHKPITYNWKLKEVLPLQDLMVKSKITN